MLLRAIEIINRWFLENKLLLNQSKTEAIFSQYVEEAEDKDMALWEDPRLFHVA